MQNRIRQLREERGMTQVRLGIELGVSQETVSAYESGKHYPSIGMLLKLARLFNTSVDYLLGLSTTGKNAQEEMFSDDGAALLASDYKEPYLMLFNKMTDLIEQMKEIQIEAEERWISAGEEKVIDFPAQIEPPGPKKSRTVHK